VNRYEKDRWPLQIFEVKFLCLVTTKIKVRFGRETYIIQCNRNKRNGLDGVEWEFGN